jgi:hypothetical protein
MIQNPWLRTVRISRLALGIARCQNHFSLSGDRAYCAGDGTSSDDLLILQKVRRAPNWSCRLGSAEVKPSGWLGDRVLSPCKG